MPETGLPGNATYTRWFSPPDDSKRERAAGATGDRTSVPVYIYDEAIIRSVNVAGVTRRPLLVEGPSGCGKSSLAEHIAHTMKWDFYRFTVTSRTQAGDLLYRIDQLKRLRDAQASKSVEELRNYIQPGVLWQAFDKEGAKNLSASKPGLPEDDQSFQIPEPGEGNGTVVLLDEIDKADPDIPNNLLLPFGSYQFHVDELDFDVYAQRVPLLILTTNNERRLPEAFLRRCVNLVLQSPDEDRLVAAGRAHFPDCNPQLIEDVANLLLHAASERARPSTAEYLDTVRACKALNVNPKGPDWQWLKQITAWKRGRSPEA